MGWFRGKIDAMIVLGLRYLALRNRALMPQVSGQNATLEDGPCLFRDTGTRRVVDAN